MTMKTATFHDTHPVVTGVAQFVTTATCNAVIDDKVTKTFGFQWKLNRYHCIWRVFADSVSVTDLHVRVLTEC